ncbi:MAG: cytidine deaminase [Clostridia bacterium]
MSNQELIKLALQAREMSYSPYSNFKVGACLVAKDGEIFTGCNIENIAFTPTICAERTAFFKAVSSGVTEFSKIAIVGGVSLPLNSYAFPCGVCRQVMLEFCDVNEFKVIVAKSETDFQEYKLSELMPMSFSPKNQVLGTNKK